MTLILSGTDGLSDIDGTASTPAIRGTDANTGIFFPAADTIAFAEGGTEVMRIDSSGEVTRFNTNPGGMTVKRTDGVNSNGWLNFVGSDDVVDGSVRMATDAANALTFLTAATERARIDSSGNLLVGQTSQSFTSNGFSVSASGGGGFIATGGAGDGPQVQMVNLTAAATVPNGYRWFSFRIGSTATEIGKIEKASSTTIAFTTSSDYRLKENITPLTGALAKVAAMRPVKWDWIGQTDGGEGFIAHELQKICPQAVVGEKDAMEEDGVTPRYQGVDTSLLVATLTAAIQEQQAMIQELTAKVAALEAKG
jgi:hypothetical protein